MKKNRVNLIDKVFFLLLILILLAGLLTTMFWPDDVNAYENRYANKIVPFSVKAYSDGSFQNSVDDALSDQIQFSTIAKKVYNYTAAAVAAPAIESLQNHTNVYVYSDGHVFYKGKLLHGYNDFDAVKDLLDAKLNNLNTVIQQHPELDFYAYYIEKDTDIDFVSGKKSGISDYVLSNLDIVPEKMGCFRVDSFEQFDEYFYDTDHHWNYKGSYEGYKQVLNLISDEEPLEPTEVFRSGKLFAGSKAMGLGRLYTDEMSIYTFDMPTLTITVNGIESRYGSENELVNGLVDVPTYGTVYGGDNGETVFDTGHSGDNILVIGESYDNAILKLIACSFAKTYSIDLRNYEAMIGESFDFSSYVKEHDISKVLLIGSGSFYYSSDFML